MPEKQRRNLLERVKNKIKSKSKSNKRAAAAAADFALSRWWRLYCLLSCLAGCAGQMGSLLGLFQTPSQYWFETDSHFIYSQITFVTSTLFIYMNFSLTINRPSGSTPRTLLMYPVVTLAYFTIFTKGIVWGLSPQEYMNHVLNQALHQFSLLFCPALRRYILRGGLGLAMKDITFFVFAYYFWIWQCFFSLGRWPYDFLDMREKQGNIIFSGVAVGCYIMVALNFYLCSIMERMMTGNNDKKKIS